MNEIKIPDFTREEYLSTSVPYEWLNKFSSNKFQMQQLMTQLGEKAALIGIKNFKAMFRLYMESMKPQSHILSYNSTNFSGQEMQLDCGDWVCDDFAITGKDRYGNEIVVCTHPIMPIQRLINIDNETEKLK